MFSLKVELKKGDTYFCDGGTVRYSLGTRFIAKIVEGQYVA